MIDCLIDCFTKTSRALIGYFQSPVRVETDKFLFMQKSTSTLKLSTFFSTNEILLPIVSCESKKAIDTVRTNLKIHVYDCFLRLSPSLKTNQRQFFMRRSVLTNCEEIQKTTTEINDEYLPQDCDDGLGRRTNTIKKNFPKLQNTLRAKVNNCRKLRNTSIYIYGSHGTQN